MTTPPGLRHPDVSGSPGEIFRMLREGVATSRSTLARATGLAPSTISLRVEALRERGLVEESGSEESRGGRRARQLVVRADAGLVAAADVGAHHLRVGVADLLGQRVVTEERLLDVATGPGTVLPLVWTMVEELVAGSGRDSSRLLGMALGLPGPIEVDTGRVILPSFMPGWHNADIAAAFKELTDLPVLVENDANLVALAEHATAGTGADHLLAVKLGTRIGCGIISSGVLQRGAGGAAGEVSHVPVAGTATVGCVCGIPNCLESVASGGAIVKRLQAAGYSVSTPAEVIDLANQGDVTVIAALREAGTLIGEVLAAVVNFANPRVVALSGAMSAAEPLVAAVRSALFQRCLPLAARDLDVRVGVAGADSGVTGGLRLVLEHVLSPERIDSLLVDHRPAPS